MSELNICNYNSRSYFTPQNLTEQEKETQDTSTRKVAVGAAATIAIGAMAVKAFNAYQTPALMNNNSVDSISFADSTSLADSISLVNSSMDSSMDSTVDSIVNRTTKALREAIQKKLSDNHDMLNDGKAHIDANIQTMADGEEQQRHLQSCLRDPGYCRTNFVGITTQDCNTFTADFGGGRLMEFSNRLSSQNELRGDRLQTLLATNDYGTLQDIALQGHLTPADPRLSMTLAVTIMVDFSGDEIFTREELQQLTPEQRDEVHQKVRAQYQSIDVINGLKLNQFVQV